MTPAVLIVFVAACSRVEILSPYGSTTAVSPDSDGRPRPRSTPHDGVDIKASIGQEIIASAPGIVSGIEFTEDYGYEVVVTHDRVELSRDTMGARYQTSYLHLNAVHVRFGQRVVRGEKLGTLGLFWGSGGVSHVHWRLCRALCRPDLTEDPLKRTQGCAAENSQFDDRKLILTYPVRC